MRRDVTVWLRVLWVEGSRLHIGTYYDSGVFLFCNAWVSELDRSRLYFLNWGLVLFDEENERYSRLWLPCVCVRRRDNKETWHRCHFLKVCTTASHHAICTSLCSANGSSVPHLLCEDLSYTFPPQTRNPLIFSSNLWSDSTFISSSWDCSVDYLPPFCQVSCNCSACPYDSR